MAVAEVVVAGRVSTGAVAAAVVVDLAEADMVVVVPRGQSIFRFPVLASALLSEKMVT